MIVSDDNDASNEPDDSGATADAKTGSSDSIHSVATAFQIMSLLANANRPLGVGEISVKMALGKSRVFRHLQTLSAGGYVAQDVTTEKYMPGAAWSLLATKAGNGASLGWMAERFLKALAAGTGCTAVVTQFERAGCRTVASAVPNRRLCVSVPESTLSPPHCTAYGKIGLAFAATEWVDRFRTEDLKGHTAATITSPSTLAGEIDHVREQGWALNYGEWQEGIYALAAPVYGNDGWAIGAIGIVTFDNIGRWPEETLLSQVVETAAALSINFSGAGARRANESPKKQR